MVLNELEAKRIIQLKSIGTFEIRISTTGTGEVTVEKRHQELLKKLAPTVRYYKGWLLPKREDIEFILSKVYSDIYPAYIYLPVLCNMPDCVLPICDDSKKAFMSVCQTHFDFATGKKGK